ncbi:MAG: CZB domain-containing protein [Gallionellaceae bacterium]|nr:CZB domain-containing protein [Gallionellaceae bacterium]
MKNFEPDPLWQLSSKQRPSRDYFELLLAETNHRHWINDEIESNREIALDLPPKVFLDYRQCQLGLWYYGAGKRQFGKESWFLAIEPLHQRIHQSALKLRELQQAGNSLEAAYMAEALKSQNDELDALLTNIRHTLVGPLFMASLEK